MARLGGPGKDDRAAFAYRAVICGAPYPADRTTQYRTESGSDRMLDSIDVEDDNVR
jgi:hypothetical protein